MAEIIEFRAEETIPELEAMLSLLFEKDDVQTITKTRREHEYRIHRPSKRKEDCVKYIDFEMKLIRMIRLRKIKKNIQKNTKLANLELAMSRRLNKIFILTIRWFSSDTRLWLSYIRFCKQMKFYSSASRVLEQMLELHGSTRPDLFKMAASWELRECNCLEKARKYLLMGVHVHKDSKLLLTEAFKLELLDTDRKRKECIEKGIPIDPSNVHLTTRKAESIYDCSIKKLCDVEIKNDLLNICQQYEFTNNLISKILADLFAKQSDERVWDILARREMNFATDEKLTPKQKILKCVALYDQAVKTLNTSRMWSFYIELLLEMGRDSTVLPNFKRKLLFTVLQKAASAGKLTEKYYVIWVGMLQGPEKHKKLVEVLQNAVKKLPDSVNLWHTLLKLHLTKGEEKQAATVFEQGTTTLAAESLPLWKLMLQYEQTKRNNKVEELYKKSWTHCTEIANTLKPMYLEWLVLTQGIVAARKMYDVMCDMPPCLSMHKKMVYLETIQPTMNMKRIRQSFTIACVQFGYLDVDVWMDYCKFENNSGDPGRVCEIYWNARKNLAPQKFETFLSEFTLIRTVPRNGVSTNNTDRRH